MATCPGLIVEAEKVELSEATEEYKPHVRPHNARSRFSGDSGDFFFFPDVSDLGNPEVIIWMNLTFF